MNEIGRFRIEFMFVNLMQLQRDTTGLTIENKELKLRLQALEQQAHLRDGMCWLTHTHTHTREICALSF